MNFGKGEANSTEFLCLAVAECVCGSVGATLALLVVLCFATEQAAATCRANKGTPLNPPPEFLGGCAPPREGLWRFQSNFEFNPEVGREPVAIAELNLVQVAENLYNGESCYAPSTFVKLDSCCDSYWTLGHS